MMYIYLFLCGALIYGVIDFIVKSPGRLLCRRFRKLGNLVGLSFNDIIYACGEPNSISTSVGTDGRPVKVVQWIEKGYHISLVFDENDVCLGINHTFVS